MSTRTLETPAPKTSEPESPPDRSLRVEVYKFYDAVSVKNLRNVLGGSKVQTSPHGLVVHFEDDRFMFVYRFGCFAFVNFSSEAIQEMRERLEGSLGAPLAVTPSDSYEIRVGKRNLVEFEYVELKRLTSDHLVLITLTIAQSAALEYFEEWTEQMLESSASVMTDLSRAGRVPLNLRGLLKTVGKTASARQEIVNKLAILDAPDETWKSKELEMLYREVRDNFEIDLRFRALDRKLRLVQDNLEIMADLGNAQRANFLELLIVILIVFEIVLALAGTL